MGENSQFLISLIQVTVVAITGIGGIWLTKRKNSDETENMVIKQLQDEFKKRDEKEEKLIIRFEKLEQINAELREENLQLMIRSNQVILEKNNIEATLLLRIKRLESENIELEGIIRSLNAEIATYNAKSDKVVDS